MFHKRFDLFQTGWWLTSTTAARSGRFSPHYGHSTQRRAGLEHTTKHECLLLFNGPWPSSDYKFKQDDTDASGSSHELNRFQLCCSLTFSFDSGLDSGSVLIWIKVRIRHHSRVCVLPLERRTMWWCIHFVYSSSSSLMQIICFVWKLTPPSCRVSCPKYSCIIDILDFLWRAAKTIWFTSLLSAFRGDSERPSHASQSYVMQNCRGHVSSENSALLPRPEFRKT